MMGIERYEDRIYAVLARAGFPEPEVRQRRIRHGITVEQGIAHMHMEGIDPVRAAESLISALMAQSLGRDRADR